MTKAVIGKTYKHYKGGLYKILNIAIHTENGEELVIYQGLETDKVWARPKEMFEETININNRIIDRFQKID